MNQNQLLLIAKEISFHMEKLISQQSDFSCLIIFHIE